MARLGWEHFIQPFFYRGGKPFCDVNSDTNGNIPPGLGPNFTSFQELRWIIDYE